MREIRYFFIFLFFIPLLSFSQIRYFKLSPLVTDSDYIHKTIILEVKEEYRGQCNESDIKIDKFLEAFSEIGSYDLKKKFPGKSKPATEFNKYGEKMADLSLIYELKYGSDLSIEKAINTLLASGVLDYAEPHYLPHLLDIPCKSCTDSIPNDPYADSSGTSFYQYHLINIQAYKAWCILQGDTNVVVGIVDTGTDLFHPDLYGNIKKNYLDPINGIDDDGDGFTDNFFGWDLAENDSSPQCENIYMGDHGAFVAGLSSAIVNNNEGCAGVGFKCKYLPVKIENASGSLVMAYEGIVYAAEHGCSVINCSWGGAGSSSQYGQTVIDYATNNCNALVVAACGNSDNSYPFYPASYNHVLSVAATNWADCKWHDTTYTLGSSYGIYVDLSAPGQSIFSTRANGSYGGLGGGTSFSSPIVAGAAALIKKHYPTYSAIQLGEQLRLTTDNIDTISCNTGQPWTGLTGTGRLNIYKALTVNNLPSIVMISHSETDNNDEAWVANDTLRVVGTFKNYLEPSTNLVVTISSTSPYVTILNSTTSLFVIGTNMTKDNSLDPFLVKILPGVPASTQIDFKLNFDDAAVGYHSYQYFSIVVNVDYIDIDTNRVAVTVTSKGKIGYNVDGSFSQGMGFQYDNSASYLYAGGFLVGVSTSQVSDEIYGNVSGNYDNDFKTVSVVHRTDPPVKADFETYNVFNDSLAPSTTRLKITVTHKSFAWANTPNDKYVIMEFTVKNHGSQTLNSLYAGLFMDWEMSDGQYEDKIDYDATNEMGYTYSLLGGPYVALKLLSLGPVHHYAFEVGKPTSIDFSNGLSSYDKYSALKNNNPIHNYTSSDGNDVADMISTGPYTITPGDSIVVAFALIAGDHLADIQSSAENADEFYNHYGIDEYPDNNINSLQVYPNPADYTLSFSFDLASSSNAEVAVFDINGKEVLNHKLGKLAQGEHVGSVDVEKLSAGNYSLLLKADKNIKTKEFTIAR